MDTIPHQLARIERKLDLLLERTPPATANFASTTDLDPDPLLTAPEPPPLPVPPRPFPANPIPKTDL